MKILLIIGAILAYLITVFLVFLVGAYAGEMKARKRRIRLTVGGRDENGAFYIQEIEEERRKPS